MTAQSARGFRIGLTATALALAGAALPARAGQPDDAASQAAQAAAQAAADCAAQESDAAPCPAEGTPGLPPPLDDTAMPPLDSPFGEAWIGAAPGDATLIVFVDYACPGCREAQAVIDRLVAEDPGLRVVYRIVVNEPQGEVAALTSLAVAQQGGGRWAAFHRALDAAGAPSRKTIARALAAAGIAPASLPAIDPARGVPDELTSELGRNFDALNDLGTGFVPSWFVAGGPPASSTVDYEAIRAALAQARAKAR